MKPAWTLLLLLAAACGSGSIDTHEDAANATLDVMDDMISVLSDVDDKASAEAAKPDLQKLVKRWEEIQKRAKELGEPSPEEEKRLMEKLDSAMKDRQAKMMAAVQKLLKSPEAMMVLQGVLEKMDMK